MFTNSTASSGDDNPGSYYAIAFYERSTMKSLSSIVAVFVAAATATSTLAWDPSWEELDKRPTPSWYDEGKLGVFVHWGLFSVPSFGSEWFWWYWQGNSPDKRYSDFVAATETPNFAYADYAHRFDASLYRPEEWANLFSKSGAQYVVLTSKHHEGFCNWDSRDIPLTWNWNAMDVGPRRDILGGLAREIKQTKSLATGDTIHWGVYHSLFEWFNPLFLRDKANNYTTRTFVEQKTMPELYDLVKKYEPELIWSDGDWGAPSDYWGGPEFLAWYATNSTVKDTAVWNDRWGTGVTCNHGAFITCKDRFQPGKLVEKKWENALTIDPGSWGYNRNKTGAEYLDAKYLIHELIETVAFGGNMLVNVGPAADGTIPAIFWQPLLGLGEWLNINGEAIYKTTPWKVAQNQSDVGAFYTLKGETLHALVTQWPKNNLLMLTAPIPTKETKVRMIGYARHEEEGSELVWSSLKGEGSRDGAGGGIIIEVPTLTPDLIPCQHAWVFALTAVGNVPEQKLHLENDPVPSLRTK